MPLFARCSRCITGEPRCCQHATIDSRTPGERRQHSAVGGVATCDINVLMDINAESCIRCSYKQHYSISIAKCIAPIPIPIPISIPISHTVHRQKPRRPFNRQHLEYCTVLSLPRTPPALLGTCFVPLYFDVLAIAAATPCVC